MKALSLLVVFGLLLSWAGLGYGERSGMVCGEDLNGDGFVDGVGETAQCIGADLCPISAQACTDLMIPPEPCPGGGWLDTDRDRCLADPLPSSDCPAPELSYNPDLDKCQGPITCPQGNYDSVRNLCVAAEATCPAGDFPCLNNGSGHKFCSPNPCVDLAVTPPEELQPADTSAYEDDGTVDPATGHCSGQFYIFNGRGRECLPSGIKTAFFNCCSADPANFLFLEKNCPPESVEAVQAKISGRAHALGSYCKKKLPLIGCVQRGEVYCVFNSKLGRIIHEHGRPQLQSFAPAGNWGNAQSPNCEGLTPQEFQSLDFSQIDLEEFYADIKGKAQEQVKQNIEGAVDDFFNQVQ